MSVFFGNFRYFTDLIHEKWMNRLPACFPVHPASRTREREARGVRRHRSSRRINAGALRLGDRRRHSPSMRPPGSEAMTLLPFTRPCRRRGNCRMVKWCYCCKSFIEGLFSKCRTVREAVIQKYGFGIFWSDEDQGYIAICPDFPGLSAFGDTAEQALQEAKTILKLFAEAISNQV